MKSIRLEMRSNCLYNLKTESVVGYHDDSEYPAAWVLQHKGKRFASMEEMLAKVYPDYPVVSRARNGDIILHKK